MRGPFWRIVVSMLKLEYEFLEVETFLVDHVPVCAYISINRPINYPAESDFVLNTTAAVVYKFLHA